MKTYTVEDINEHNPCYDPTRHFDIDKSYTLLDFLEHKTCPHKDKIWIVTRFLSDKENRLFAIWCARRALSRVDNPHHMAIHAVNIAEKYAHGEATDEELESAHDEAYWYAGDNVQWSAFISACSKACWAAYHAACWTSDYSETERKAQIKYLKSICEGLS